jgi:hypothetical protein
MSCERCGGFMLIETNWHLMELDSREGSSTRRCVNCGNVEDDIIRANRAISSRPRYLDQHTVELRSPRVTQPIRLEQVIQTEGGIAECPRDRAPDPPVGAPSAKPRMPEFLRIEPQNPAIQIQRRCA